MNLQKHVNQWVGHALDYGHEEAREEAVATILAGFREALLSDEAVTAATGVVMQTEYPWASARSRAAITAAFDAITGGDK